MSAAQPDAPWIRTCPDLIGGPSKQGPGSEVLCHARHAQLPSFVNSHAPILTFGYPFEYAHIISNKILSHKGSAKISWYVCRTTAPSSLSAVTRLPGRRLRAASAQRNTEGE